MASGEAIEGKEGDGRPARSSASVRDLVSGRNDSTLIDDALAALLARHTSARGSVVVVDES